MHFSPEQIQLGNRLPDPDSNSSANSVTMLIRDNHEILEDLKQEPGLLDSDEIPTALESEPIAPHSEDDRNVQDNSDQDSDVFYDFSDSDSIDLCPIQPTAEPTLPTLPPPPPPPPPLPEDVYYEQAEEIESPTTKRSTEDTIVLLERLHSGLSLLAIPHSFPEPNLYGEQDDNLSFHMFIEHVRTLFQLNPHVFRDDRSKIIFALNYLESEMLTLFQWDKEKKWFENVENFADVERILEEHAEKPEQSYNMLLNSKRLLERQLQTLRNKISSKNVAHGMAIHSWNQFKERFDKQPVSAIQVLIGKPKFYWQRNSAEEKEPLISEDFSNDTDPNLSHWFEKWREGREIPERIRINSPHLIQILKKINVGVWGEYSFEEPVDDEDQPSVVFLRPYKFLYHFRSEIQAQEKVLEERLSTNQGGPRNYQVGGNDGDESSQESQLDETSSSEDMENKEDALKHLRKLIEFIQAAVAPIADKLRLTADDANAPTRVHFQDLWYLFRPGDDVYVTGDISDHSETKKGSKDRNASSKPSAWRVLNTTDGRPLLSAGVENPIGPPATTIAPFVIALYNIDYSGNISYFGPTHRRVEIGHFEGEKEITSLKAVPMRFNKDPSLKLRFKRIGEKFLRLIKDDYVHQQYTGPTLTRSPTGYEYPNASKAMLVRERVMVDFHDGANEMPPWVPRLCIPEELSPDEFTLDEAWPMKVWKKKDDNTWESTARPENIYNDTHIDRALMWKYIEDNKLLNRFEKWIYGPMSEDTRLTKDHIPEEDIILLPNRVVAFRYSRKEYVNITVEELEDLPESSDNWEEVVFNDNIYRTMLEALVKSHGAKRGNIYQPNHVPTAKPGHDLVVGKGEGLIILLHGGPGVGKTSTVECLSDSLKIPLLPFSCGALGTDPAYMELNLRRLFRKAERWNCLILFDEADVVLVERDRNQMAQNEICSILLRELEYYQGIIFLTTNRPGHIDEAVKSRVHLAVYYPPLTEDSLNTIWRNNLKRIKNMSGNKKTIKFRISKQEIRQTALDFIKKGGLMEECNGRVIRNICHVALSLAEVSNSNDDIVSLEWSHFESALQAWKDFEKYMKETLRQSGSARAREHGTRADHFQ